MNRYLKLNYIPYEDLISSFNWMDISLKINDYTDFIGTIYLNTINNKINRSISVKFLPPYYD